MMTAGANHGGGDPRGQVMPEAPASPEQSPSPEQGPWPEQSPSEEQGPWPADRRITIGDLQAATDRGERWSMLTSYDTLTAGVFEEAGVRALLVGDTSGELVLGYPDTVPVTMDQLIPMVQAVVRGTRTALVVADLPFGSYQSGPEAALASAVRHLKEGGAQAVKLEGGRRVVPQVSAMVGAGIPVMGHLGLTPQSINVLGGMRRVQGRGDAGEELLADAVALEQAGAFAVVLESVPAGLGRRVADALRIPVVGIGAGPDCDAQILVWPDMAGLTAGRLPRFVRQYADLRGTLLDAARHYTADVAARRYPDEAHSYA
jgi:3-methyl-2-oxobutanoate hydroxymethyltransferase